MAWAFPSPASSSAPETAARPGVRLSTSFITTEAPRRIQSCTFSASGCSTGAPSREVALTLYCAGGTATLSSTILKLVSVQMCDMSSRPVDRRPVQHLREAGRVALDVQRLPVVELGEEVLGRDRGQQVLQRHLHDANSRALFGGTAQSR